MRERSFECGLGAWRLRPWLSRRGSAYAIVLMMSGIVSTVALGGLALRRASIDRAQSTAEATRAMELARSAVELGLYGLGQLDGDIDPRSVEGVWVNQQRLGAGTISVRAVALDSSAILSLNLFGIVISIGESETPSVLTVVGEGQVGDARRRLSVVAESVNKPEYRDRAMEFDPAGHWPLNEWPLNTQARELVSGDLGSYSSILLSGTLGPHAGGPAPDMQNVSSYVTLPSSGVKVDEGTFSLWVRRPGGAPADAVVLQAGHNNESQYLIRFVGGNLMVVHKDAKGKTATVVGPSLSAWTWHHLVGTYGPGGTQLYVNGVLVGSEPSASGGMSISSGSLIYVGVGQITSSSSTNSSVGGAVREVSVFPHAMSAAEVTKMYGDGKHQNSGSGWKLVAGSWRPVVD